MNRPTTLIAFVLAMLVFTGCKPRYLEVDMQIVQEAFYNPTATRYEGLRQSTVLYLDHSTCVIDAVQNSPVFKALRPNLGQYCDTLQLIMGDAFQSIPLNRQDNKVSEVLETIKDDISFADIRTAVFQICKGDQQAILISDCESYANGRFLDLEPYMSEPFRDWLVKGHSIYIITEPYKERYKGQIYDKKRFYFIFSDNRMQTPISANMIGEVQSLIQSGVCSLYEMTNSDIFAQTPKEDVVDGNIDFDMEYLNGFEFVNIYTSWDDVRKYVMMLDKYGEPTGEEPAPIIKNIVFSEGRNYIARDIEIRATNITERYVAVADSLDLGGIRDVDVSAGFMLDMDALQNNRLNVLLTDKIFTEGYLLSDELGGNLIRLDFVITEVGLQPYDNVMFEWQSMWSTNTAICVSKSIDNALRDANVVPTCANREVIHTIFLQTL